MASVLGGVLVRALPAELLAERPQMPVESLSSALPRLLTRRGVNSTSLVLILPVLSLPRPSMLTWRHLHACVALSHAAAVGYEGRCTGGSRHRFVRLNR
jgi:hypothetical protein